MAIVVFTIAIIHIQLNNSQLVYLGTSNSFN